MNELSLNNLATQINEQVEIGLTTVANKRKRCTNIELETLDNQIVNALIEVNPQSVRHVFYLMTDPRLAFPVPKTEKGYKLVQRRLIDLRRNGRVDYGCITDSTRRGYHTNTFSGPADFIQRMASLYRGDLWKQSDYYVEVWCESRSIAGVIESTCEEYAVSLYPAGGFTSLTLAYQSAEYIRQQAGDKPIRILYIGDYDPAGVLIDGSVEREIRKHLPNHDIGFHRLGINEGQIDIYDLPTKPRKEGDKRALHIRETVEAEAMPVRDLIEILTSAILSYLPEGALHVIKQAEQSERDGLLALANVSD